MRTRTALFIVLLLMASLVAACSNSSKEMADFITFQDPDGEFSIKYPPHWQTDEEWKDSQTKTLSDYLKSVGDNVNAEFVLFAGVKKGVGMKTYVSVEKDVYNQTDWDSYQYGLYPHLFAEWFRNGLGPDIESGLEGLEVSEPDYSFGNFAGFQFHAVRKATSNLPVDVRFNYLIVNNPNNEDRTIWQIVCTTPEQSKRDISDCEKVIQSFEEY